MSRNVNIIGIAIILVGVIVAIYFYNLGHKDLSRVNPDYSITAEELYYEFSENEETANEKYTGKVIQVTGILKDKGITSDTSLNLVLKTSDPPGSVICSFHDSGKLKEDSLKEGQEVTVRGVCSGMLMDVILNNCVLIKP
ncbi:MAG: OB-fold protein [Bacteroidota bacterium]